MLDGRWERIASDAELLDIPGLTVGNPSAGFGSAIFASLWRTVAERRARSDIAVAMYCCWCCRGKAFSCTNWLNDVRALCSTK